MSELRIKNCRGISRFVAVAMAVSAPSAFGAGAAAPAAAPAAAAHSAPAAAAPAAHPAAAPAAQAEHSSPPAPGNAVQHADAVTRTARANFASRDENVNRFRNGTAYLIPGSYYGPEYWNGSYNGWSGYGYNNSQTYGQFQQNDQTANNNAAPASGDSSPALYEPPVQAAREAAGATADSPAMTTALKANPDYQKADAAFRSAEQEYNADRKRVIDKLKQDPTYQAAIDKKSADASKLSAMKAADKANTPEQAEPLAQQKLDAAKTVTDLQEQAVAADPQTMEAKRKLDNAVADRTAIRTQIEAAMSRPK